MAAANRTPTLCTRSPTTWMNAALTLALPWLQWPCCWCWLGLWPLPCGTPDWWRISTILHGTTSKLFQETPLWQISTASWSYSQNIDPHGTTWGYEHDLSVDVVVSIDEPLYGRQDQRCCHCPDGHNWQQHAQDLWRTHQSTSKKIWILVHDDVLEVCFLHPPSTHLKTSFLQRKHSSGMIPNDFSSPARCHPKVMTPVGGWEDSHREKRLIAMLPKSVRRCAASVMMARLRAAYPPADEAGSQKAGFFSL